MLKIIKLYVIKGLRERVGCWKGKQIKKSFVFKMRGNNSISIYS